MTYNKNIISLRAFLGKTNAAILDLVKICNLKDTNNWSEWIDDYNNTLKITDEKDLLIKLNTIIDIQYINTKDLYMKRNIKDTLKNATFSLISISDTSYYIWILDEFKILRLYSYIDGILIGQQPILISPVDTLKKIIRNLNVESFQEVYHIIEPSSKHEANKAWVTKLPMNKKLLKMLPETLQKDININDER